MGIPSYFSFIVKNYPKILKNFEHFNGTNIDNLCLDSNSIIYDSISRIINDFDNYSIQEFEEQLIDIVISNHKHHFLILCFIYCVITDS